MNALHTRMLAMLAMVAGAAHAAQTPPTTPTPPTPATPATPPMPPVPDSSWNTDQLQVVLDSLQGEVQAIQEKKLTADQQSQLQRLQREMQRLREEGGTVREKQREIGQILGELRGLQEQTGIVAERQREMARLQRDMQRLQKAQGRSADDQQRDQEHLQHELEHAQEELNRAAREVAELSVKMGEESWGSYATFFGAGPGRGAMLGVNIGVTAHGHDEGSSDAGVRIVSVSPGGPADQAGLKANDVIVSIAGKALLGDKDKDQSPAQQLQSQMRQLQPDTPVEVEYRRDGKVQKVQVTPKSPREVNVMNIRNAVDDLRNTKMGPINFEGPFWADSEDGFGSAELAELSPGLGRYFAADKGLLVVRAPKDERLKLQDGDVILDIDGRIPGDPSHAYEILSSYHRGETLKMHVMRQQKKLELSVEIPEDGHAGRSHLRAEGFGGFNLVSPRTFQTP
jgi:hypothetical protein